MNDEQRCAECGEPFYPVGTDVAVAAVLGALRSHRERKGHAFDPPALLPAPTDEQQAERRIERFAAYKRLERLYEDAYGGEAGPEWHSAVSAYVLEVEAPLKEQIERLETLARLDRAAMDSLNGAKERAEAQVKALEERLAALEGDKSGSD